MSALKTFQIQGHTLAVTHEGMGRGGTPLVFIHGITSNLHFWKPFQTPHVAQEREWYSLSLPGHFPAVFPPNITGADLTPANIGAWLGAALHDLLGTQKAILVGHSTGGFAALCIARYCPEQVAGVVTVGGFQHGRWTGGLGAIQTLMRSGAAGRRLATFIYWLNQSSACFNYTQWWPYAYDLKGMYARLKPYFRPVHAEFAAQDRSSFLLYFRHMPDVALGEELRQIHAPALIIVGEHDPIVDPRQSDLIAQRLPYAHLIKLPACGHLPMLETPDAYHNAITNWLKTQKF